MIVCLCRGFSERDLRGLIATTGVESAEELSETCGAGGDCGACLSTLDRLIEDARRGARRPALVPAEAYA